MADDLASADRRIAAALVWRKTTRFGMGPRLLEYLRSAGGSSSKSNGNSADAVRKALDKAA
jgi:hypothetical protein